MNIKYINEKTFKYYSVDNYLVDYNLIIEIMGDYFHANPILYDNYDNLNEMQKKDIIRDKRKNTYIKKYIENSGKLDDYNSFNFLFYDDTLALKSNIINPYFKITP